MWRVEDIFKTLEAGGTLWKNTGPKDLTRNDWIVCPPRERMGSVIVGDAATSLDIAAANGRLVVDPEKSSHNRTYYMAGVLRRVFATEHIGWWL